MVGLYISYFLLFVGPPVRLRVKFAVLLTASFRDLNPPDRSLPMTPEVLRVHTGLLPKAPTSVLRRVSLSPVSCLTLPHYFFSPPPVVPPRRRVPRPSSDRTLHRHFPPTPVYRH